LEEREREREMEREGERWGRDGKVKMEPKTWPEWRLEDWKSSGSD